MFEGWAADVLASYIGKFVNVQRDSLKISLWGGQGVLENVKLRVEAFEYLQLPFVIKEGSIGRLKLQASEGSGSDYDSFGFQLTSLATVSPSAAAELLAAFPGTQSSDAAAAIGVKVVRQLHFNVHQSSSSGGSSAGAASGHAPARMSCQTFVGATEVALQLSTQQLRGMAVLADDAAIWAKRNLYGRFRPPGWITVAQAARHNKASKLPVLADVQQPSSSAARSMLGASGHLPPSRCWLVPTGRVGIGAPVSWVQQKLDSLQAVATGSSSSSTAAAATSSTSQGIQLRPTMSSSSFDTESTLSRAASSDIASPNTASSCASGPGLAAAPAAGKTEVAAATAVAAELLDLEQELDVDEILLCRALAEVAVERRNETGVSFSSGCSGFSEALSSRKELLVLDLEGTRIRGSLSGTRLSAELSMQDFRLFDCCSDPGVHECVLQRLDPGSPVASVGAVLLSSSHGWGSGLTGLSLSQGSGLHRLSPEAFGWDAGTALPVVSSSSSARVAAATAVGATAGSGGDAGARHTAGRAAAGGGRGTSGSGRPVKQPLLSIGVDVEGHCKSISVQLQQLQLLARPGSRIQQQ
eukprot:gene7319-7531_t